MDGSDTRSSYERINYGLRPAKCVERKMLCDIFRRLTPFGRVSAYRYVGFGSAYFSDFSLFHRTLGMENMISIERDENNAERFRFNAPFKCVRLLFGESGAMLATLPWEERTICWLDYDGRLDSSVLADVEFFAANACAGSVLLLSFNVSLGQDDALTGSPPTEPQQPLEATPDEDDEAYTREGAPKGVGPELQPQSPAEPHSRPLASETGEPPVSSPGPSEDTSSAERSHAERGTNGRRQRQSASQEERLSRRRLAKLRGMVGLAKVPVALTGRELRGWGLADVSRDIVINQLQETLSIRNGGRSSQTKLHLKDFSGALVVTHPAAGS